MYCKIFYNSIIVSEFLGSKGIWVLTVCIILYSKKICNLKKKFECIVNLTASQRGLNKGETVVKASVNTAAAARISPKHPFRLAEDS